MASVIHLDTHVVVWLFIGDLRLFPSGVRGELNRYDLRVSPIVDLEVQHLHEVGRLTVPASVVMHELTGSIGLDYGEASFGAVVRASLANDWTRDPFDRLIAAQATVEGVPLLTKDATIRRHCGMAYWTTRP